MTLAIILIVTQLIALLVLGLLLMQANSHTRGTVQRLEGRVEDQQRAFGEGTLRLTDTAHRTENVVNGLQRSLADGQTETQQDLQKNLYELGQGQSKSLELFQEKLLERTGVLQTTIEQRLGEVRESQAKSSGQLGETLVERFEVLQKAVDKGLNEGMLKQQSSLGNLNDHLQKAFSEYRQAFEQRQADALKSLQEGLTAGMTVVQQQVNDALARQATELGARMDKLTQGTDERLKEISGQVEKRLTDGFEKTTATFADVLKRLALIDDAQKRITELSTNVVSLQEVLNDKRSRGAFGEVQLSGLMHNMLPEGAFSLQHTLSNKARVDCMLFLPKPTGNIGIDAKFPLESFRKMSDPEASELERTAARKQFPKDVCKHIADMAEKYIIPGETAEGAVMFIPSEAVFAEIHAHHPDVVEASHKARVWITSPSTLMAVLTTARAVLKDEATREQVHLIQEHLRGLAADFGRFRKRMDKLATHIRQANKDVDEVNTSANKISSRFEKIEAVEIEGREPSLLTASAAE